MKILSYSSMAINTETLKVMLETLATQGIDVDWHVASSIAKLLLLVQAINETDGAIQFLRETTIEKWMQEDIWKQVDARFSQLNGGIPLWDYDSGALILANEAKKLASISIDEYQQLILARERKLQAKLKDPTSAFARYYRMTKQSE